MTSDTVRTIRIYRYDPAIGGEGRFDEYALTIERPEVTTILDVLLRIQREQDPSLAFRFACRVNMCGSCGLVVNGREGLACKTNVSHLPPKQAITLRPMNHFPVIKDLVVDMAPFFEKYEDALPFFEPREKRDEPYVVKPDDQKRVDIGMSTDCIACGCCVSSCTMVNRHQGYAGPAALNRAFTLLADDRDALFIPRLTRALESCYNCRTEFNCTEVCPKRISGTRAIKYIQRLAVTRLKDLRPLAPHPAELAPPAPRREESSAPCACKAKQAEFDPARRAFLRHGAAVVGAGSALALAGVLGVSSVAPTLAVQKRQWISIGKAENFPVGEIRQVMLSYRRAQAFHKEEARRPILARRLEDGSFLCFSGDCPHLGCSVSWDPLTDRFKCACHGGAFDRDGNVIAGPPPRPLERLPWKMEADLVKVEVA